MPLLHVAPNLCCASNSCSRESSNSDSEGRALTRTSCISPQWTSTLHYAPRMHTEFCKWLLNTTLRHLGAIDAVIYAAMNTVQRVTNSRVNIRSSVPGGLARTRLHCHSNFMSQNWNKLDTLSLDGIGYTKPRHLSH